ncbi:uncharacterized protein C8Q71DRAFT_709525 [Rhodofomes roseus]|uniref:DNA polymerase n=1 Tax=Rhodofomes roseus TaxID=34475 RepID=A0ABQ8KEC0_9APHY|nr:uncharacterized protein C8Q71DRAFT_709525 [Rhodofomes roseus]KAH9835559.1 hypothetical protein C8Q71DRAFT_709525 [Rhodofomes roseus]
MSSPLSTLRVRVNQIDHILAAPGPLDNSTLPRVPIIRIYGESSTGKKACVHVHQAYPYFFVEYPGKMNPDGVNHYIARLTHSLNHAIAISMKRNPLAPKSQFIRAIVLTKGVHFYGFHASYSPFLKVHIADPSFVNRAVTILQSGTVMKTRFRVYESHINFNLQFMCDFGLYGCGWMDLGEVWERGAEETADDLYESDDRNDQDDSKHTFPTSPYFRQSRMPLEVDVAVHQIHNRHRLSARNIHHRLSIPGPPLPSEPLVLSVRELWEDERQRRIARGLPPSPEIPQDPSENSRGPGAAWVAEARWWDEIRRRIERERGKEKVLPSSRNWEKWVMTTFESIEALWEDEWKTWKPGPPEGDVCARDAHVDRVRDDADEINPYAGSQMANGALSQVSRAEHAAEVEVDEELLSSQAMGNFVQEQEPDWEKLRDGYAEHDEDGPDDEVAAEDGPPPENQFTHDQPGTSSPQKYSRSRDENPFDQIWHNIVRYALASDEEPWLTIECSAKRHRSASTVSIDRTPSKNRHSIRRLTSPAYATTVRLRVVSGLTNDSLASLDVRRLKHVPLDAAAFREVDPENPFVVGTDTHRLKDDGSMKRTHAQSSDVSGEMTPRPPKKRKVHMDSDQALRLSIASSGASSLGKVSTITAASSKTTTSLGTVAIGYRYALPPPSATELLSSVDEHGIPSKVYTSPYYFRASDAPEKPREYAGLVFHLKGGAGLDTLEGFVSGTPSAWHATTGRAKLDPADVTGWEYASAPPSAREVRRWLVSPQGRQHLNQARPKQPSQIEGPTQANPYGMKATPLKSSKPSSRERQNMSTFSLEVFAPSTGNRLPDPDQDEVVAVFYSYQDSVEDNGSFACQTGMIVVENDQVSTRRLRGVQFEMVSSELDLLNRLIDTVLDVNPDIVSGWEVQAASWGYLSARANMYGYDLGEQISRAPGRHMGGGSDQWGMRTTSTFKVVGRHVLNVWRIMRAEQNLTSYTFENVVFYVLQRRTPRYSPQTLTEWYYSTTPLHTANLLRYYAARTSTVLEILDVAEVVTKNAEFARVFGVDFFSVLSRGSQFKVESFMFRIAKPESFVLLSPSKQDVGKQNAAECMPLIMEPLSAFYTSPLVVLDFQSLYPSIMIAYNYCYSTCLGRVTDFKGQYKFGVTDLQQPAGLLATLEKHINVAPNGIMYVKQDVRKGLLGRMLTELLDTRVMVKQAMKGVKDNKALRRVLDARQLGLKYIANVTYGYTSATYSGRMPAVEIADSIVQSGRETLEKAIRVIQSTKKWGARVVYGDTDSLFIYLQGKTKDQAFRIGYDIAETITAMNPAPVKLKFEKVYLPCVLMAKKRYVGFKFESPDETEPGFDAKGIETVRRDGIPAQQKMTETCLKILFRTQDLSKVKEYCCRTWAKILENKASIQDFIFAKEVRMGTYSDKVPPPPGVTVAARRMLADPNNEPQYGDRIPYVIVRGDPDSRLVDRAVSPEELLNNRQKHLDAAYYISRVLIPPLERIFNLVGADVRAWYDEMPKALRTDQPEAVLQSPRKAKRQMNSAAANPFKIDEHFLTSRCLVCKAPAPGGLCDTCRAHPQETISGLLSRLHVAEAKLQNVQTICSSCCGIPAAEPVKCESLDCPWLYERKKIENKVEAMDVVAELVAELQEAEDMQEEMVVDESP